MRPGEENESELKTGRACPDCRNANEGTAQTAQDGGAKTGGRGWLQTITALPAAVLPLLPSFTCPACIAAYAGVLSAMGIGFVLNESFLAPVIVIALVISVLTIARSTRSHRNPWPLVVTVLASLSVIAGRLIWDFPVVLYAGAGALLAASFYNLWLKRPREKRLPETSPAV